MDDLSEIDRINDSFESKPLLEPAAEPEEVRLCPFGLLVLGELGFLLGVWELIAGYLDGRSLGLYVLLQSRR